MKLDRMFMNMADCAAECSTAQRKKVGAIIMRDGRILSVGYNGTFPGTNNSCEYEIYDDFSPNEITYTNTRGDQYQLRTHSDVLHAEFNAISKLARDGESALNSTMYVTLSPCKECAKLIANVGIKNVIFKDLYRDPSGTELLKSLGVSVIKYNVN